MDGSVQGIRHNKKLFKFTQQSSIYPCFHSSSSLIFYHFHVLCNSHFQLIIKVMITIAILKCEKHACHNWNLRVESCHKWIRVCNFHTRFHRRWTHAEKKRLLQNKKKFERRALGACWLKDEWFDLFPSLNKDFHLLLLLLLILLLLARSLFNRSDDAATVAVSRWSCELEMTSRMRKQI